MLLAFHVVLLHVVLQEVTPLTKCESLALRHHVRDLVHLLVVQVGALCLGRELLLRAVLCGCLGGDDLLSEIWAALGGLAAR